MVNLSERKGRHMFQVLFKGTEELGMDGRVRLDCTLHSEHITMKHIQRGGVWHMDTCFRLCLYREPTKK